MWSHLQQAGGGAGGLHGLQDRGVEGEEMGEGGWPHLACSEGLQKRGSGLEVGREERGSSRGGLQFGSARGLRGEEG